MLGVAKSCSAPDESLKGLLEKLHWAEGSSPAPPEEGGYGRGLWAVKWIQGGVAAGATRAVANFRRKAFEVDLYGSFASNAKRLAEHACRSHLPVDALQRAERHWVMALRHLRRRELPFRLVCRQGNRKQIVSVDVRGKARIWDERFEGGSGTLSVTVESPKAGRLSTAPSLWTAEVAAMSARLRYCHLPVLLGPGTLSQNSAYHDKRALMSWMEPAIGDEPSFTIFGDPKQILAPHLIRPDHPSQALHRCSLLLSLRAGLPGTGLARVWWSKDGALVGPVQVVGPTGVLGLEIVCPGDRPGELSEWAARDPWTFFPDKLVLTVARRLDGGLDSLLPELAAREGAIGLMLRQANAMTGFRNWLPVAGRPCLALSGPFHASLKAFSLRKSLELVAGS
jgi:hypothetical protein